MAISAILAGLSIKKILANKYVLIGLIVLSVGLSCYIGGRVHQWKIDSMKDLKAENDALRQHIINKDKVKEHYEIPKDAECILSGRASMNSPGCKAK